MTIVTICWNWVQALNHTVILENVTRAQRIYIWIMNIFIVYTRTYAHMHAPNVRRNAMHLENIDVDISIDQIQIWARAVFSWLYGLIFAYTTLVTIQAGKQNIKSHIQAYYFERAMCSTLLSCYSVAAFSHYSLWHCMSKCWAFACIGSIFSQLP